MPKTNKYAFVVFVDPDEDADEVFGNLVDFLTSNHFSAAISPLHDKDVWTPEEVQSWIESQISLYSGGYQGETYMRSIDWNAPFYTRPPRRSWQKQEHRWIEIPEEKVTIPHPDDLKKPHFHVYVRLDYSMTAIQMIEKFAKLKVTYFEPVNSERGYIRYLAHLDNPEKFRYNILDVCTLGGVDISPIFQQTEQDKINMYADLFHLIEKYKPKNVFQLTKLAVEDYKMFCEVKGNHGFWSRYLTEKCFYDAKEAKEKEADTISQDVND